MKIAPHSSIYHCNEDFQVFRCFRLFELSLTSEKKPENLQNF